MKSLFNFYFLLALLLAGSCSDKKTGQTPLANPVEERLQKLSQIRTQSEKNGELERFLAFYDKQAISMPEYQATLQGMDEIKTYYTEIFKRQNIKSFQRNTEEFINLGKTIIEIGNFNKQYTYLKSDTLLTQNGKYWNIWEVQPGGGFILKGEAFGFFHPVEDPGQLVVHLDKSQLDTSDFSLDRQTPFELKAYNALMEKGVRNRDGKLRSEFFTGDATFMPFADSTKRGIEKLKPYMLAYNSGKVSIDSISVYTYHCEYLDDYVLEYPKFRVKWSVPQFSGRSQGKGIRIWKRQPDHSLRIYREIGTHNHLE